MIESPASNLTDFFKPDCFPYLHGARMRVYQCVRACVRACMHACVRTFLSFCFTWFLFFLKFWPDLHNIWDIGLPGLMPASNSIRPWFDFICIHNSSSFKLDSTVPWWIWWSRFHYWKGCRAAAIDSFVVRKVRSLNKIEESSFINERTFVVKIITLSCGVFLISNRNCIQLELT